MSEKLIPGTVLPYENVNGGMFQTFIPMIKMTNGLSLGQICSITGLEISTIQNWVKRGYVPHPEKKKYYEKHLARILMISALRDSMKIERIGDLMQYVNGDTDDESDDIISETELYDYLCETVRQMDVHGISEEETVKLIKEVTASYSEPVAGAAERLRLALLVMVFAYVSSKLRRDADEFFNRLMK